MIVTAFATKLAFAILLLIILRGWRPLRAWRAASELWPLVIATGYLAHRMLSQPLNEQVLVVIAESSVWLGIYLTILYAARHEAEELSYRPCWRWAAMAAICSLVLFTNIV
jgi:hypothetical protein